jgi:hypothetical protein
MLPHQTSLEVKDFVKLGMGSSNIIDALVYLLTNNVYQVKTFQDPSSIPTKEEHFPLSKI